MSMKWTGVDFIIRESYLEPRGKVAAIRHILMWNKFESLYLLKTKFGQELRSQYGQQIFYFLNINKLIYTFTQTLYKAHRTQKRNCFCYRNLFVIT